MKQIGIKPQEALDGRKTFYAKKWQQNGFYPIDKFVWNEEKQAWENFVQKESGWRSYGCSFAKPFQCGDKLITNFTWWLYIFEHGSYIISYNEMTDNKHFNGR